MFLLCSSQRRLFPSPVRMVNPGEKNDGAAAKAGFRSRTGSLHDICFSAGGPDRAPASRLLGKALYGEGAEFCVFLANLPGLLVRC